MERAELHIQNTFPWDIDNTFRKTNPRLSEFSEKKTAKPGLTKKCPTRLQKYHSEYFLLLQSVGIFIPLELVILVSFYKGGY
jgi:hypothetical protein